MSSSIDDPTIIRGALPKSLWVHESMDPADWNALVKRIEYEHYSHHFPYDCDDIRTRIAKHLAEKKQTLKSFLEDLGHINNNTYTKFMSRKGAKEGSMLNIYPAAVHFFRELDQKEGNEGKHMDVENVDTNINEHNKKNSTKKVKVSRADKEAAEAQLAAELDTVEETLDHDDDGYAVVPKMVTCNTIRKKINQFIATSGFTQNFFLKYNNINSNSYQRFMKFTGSMQGADNQTYRAALQFFAKYDKLMKFKKKQEGKTKNPAPRKRKMNQSNNDSDTDDNNNNNDYSEDDSESESSDDDFSKAKKSKKSQK